MAIGWIIAGLAALGIGAFLIVTYWREIVGWLNKVIPAIRELFKTIAHGIAVFAKKVAPGVVDFLHRTFYKENNQWIRETTTERIDESEVPPRIKAKINSQEKDVSKEIQPELSYQLDC